MDKPSSGWTKATAATAILCCCLGLLYGLAMSNGFISQAVKANIDGTQVLTVRGLCGVFIFLSGVLGAILSAGQFVALIMILLGRSRAFKVR